jgi:multimeric flavodoxin WrbA
MTQPPAGLPAAARDDWPALWPRVESADILVVGSPIWPGEKSSVASRLIERLYAMSGMLNDAGQYHYYGRVGGVIVTGNEDGVKPAGSVRQVRGRPTSTRAPAARRTTSPRATRRS